MANLSTIITGQTPLGGATEKNYIQASDAPGALWVASAAGVAVSLETSVGNLPESTTKKSAIKILRASGSDYVRYRFIIDKVDGSKTFKIQWAQSYAGTAGDYTISVVSFTDAGYSVGATTLPVTVSNIPAINGVWTVTFNTLAFATAPYIELRVNAIAGTTPLYISGVIVGPGITAQGAVISEWQSYTGSGSWVTNTTYSAFYRRVGSHLEARVKMTLSGAPDAGTGVNINLPSGLTIDSSVIDVNNNPIVGHVRYFDTSASTGYWGIVVGISTLTAVRLRWNDDDAVGIKDANGTAGSPFAFATGDTVDVTFSVPIAQWAGSGTVTLSSGAIVEYASNSSTTSGNDTTSFVSGSAGSLVPTITASAGTARADKTVQFTNPIQADDILTLEFQNAGTGAWQPAGDAINYDKFHAENTNRIGVGILFNPTSTTVVVGFAHGGSSGQNTYGAVGSSYPVGVGDRWRVRKSKASAPVGIDTSSLSGSGGSGFIISVKTSNFTAATLNHYLVDTSATAVTATLPAGATSASIKFSDDQRTWSVRPLTITPSSGERIDGQAINEQFICDVSGATVQLSWDGSRWVLDSNVIQSTVSITTGNSLTEKNYVTRPDSAATDWSTSNAAQVTATTESVTANLPENATKTTAIKVLRAAGTTSYVYTRFVLDSADATKKLKLQWNQKFAGASGDFTIALFSFTASDYSTGSTQLTTLQTSTVPALTSGTFITTFDAPAASAPYIELRIIAAAGTTPLYLSGVLIGPGVTTLSAAVSEWQNYTPNWGNVTLGNGTSQGLWRRVGSSMQVRAKLTFGSTTSIAGSPSVSLPSGHNIDTTGITPVSSTTQYGLASLGDAGSQTYYGFVNQTGASTTTVVVNSADDNGGSAIVPGTINATTPFTWTTTDTVNVDFTVPIAEWSGNGTVSLGAGAQVEYAYNSSTSTTSDTTSFANGPVGALIQNFAPAGTTAISKRVRFQHPIQDDDVLTLELNDTLGTFIPYQQRFPGFATNDAASAYYGVTINRASTTDVDVNFYSAAWAGSAWSVFNTYRWRVRKAKASSPVGFGLAGSDGSAGLVAPYSAAGIIASGIYTPTITNTSNVTASAPLQTLYTRVGSIVTVTGTFNCTATAGGGAASLVEISLPIASNLTLAQDVSGTAVRDTAAGTAMGGGYFSANTANDRAYLTFNSTTTANTAFGFTFQYIIK